MKNEVLQEYTEHSETFEKEFNRLVESINGFESGESPISEVLQMITECINSIRKLEEKEEIEIFAQDMALMMKNDHQEGHDVVAGILPEEENIIGLIQTIEDGKQMFLLTNEDALRKAVEMKVGE